MKILVVALLFFILIGCVFGQSNKNQFIQRPFSETDANKIIVLDTGKTFEIALPENKNSGYSWSMDLKNNEILRGVSHKYLENEDRRIGSIGKSFWVFRTIQNGEAKIRAEYKKLSDSDDNDEPTKVIEFNFYVN